MTYIVSHTILCRHGRLVPQYEVVFGIPERFSYTCGIPGNLVFCLPSFDNVTGFAKKRAHFLNQIWSWVLAMAVCRSQGCGNTLVISFAHYPIAWTVRLPTFDARVLTVIQRGQLLPTTVNSNVHSMLWGNNPGFAQATYSLPSNRLG